MAGVEYHLSDMPEDLMARVFEAEAKLRAHIERLYPDLKDGELEREFQDYAQRAAAEGPEGQGGGAGPVGADGFGPEGHDPGAGNGPGRPPQEHFGRHDPESLKPFTDPIRKPAAFQQQADDLARELAPPPEGPAGTQGESGAGAGKKARRDGGAAGKGAGEAPGASGEKPEFGPAQAQIEALRRLPDDDLFADSATGTQTTVADARKEIERQARAVERLRGCVEEEG